MPNEHEIADIKTIAHLLLFRIGRLNATERAVEALSIAALDTTDAHERAQLESIAEDLKRDRELFTRFLQRVERIHEPT